MKAISFDQVCPPWTGEGRWVVRRGRSPWAVTTNGCSCFAVRGRGKDLPPVSGDKGSGAVSVLWPETGGPSAELPLCELLSSLATVTGGEAGPYRDCGGCEPDGGILCRECDGEGSVGCECSDVEAVHDRDCEACDGHGATPCVCGRWEAWGEAAPPVPALLFGVAFDARRLLAALRNLAPVGGNVRVSAHAVRGVPMIRAEGERWVYALAGIKPEAGVGAPAIVIGGA